MWEMHSSGIQCHCCACNVDYANLDNHLVQCSYLTADMMNEIAMAGDNEIRGWSCITASLLIFTIEYKTAISVSLNTRPQGCRE